MQWPILVSLRTRCTWLVIRRSTQSPAIQRQRRHGSRELGWSNCTDRQGSRTGALLSVGWSCRMSWRVISWLPSLQETPKTPGCPGTCASCPCQAHGGRKGEESLTREQPRLKLAKYVPCPQAPMKPMNKPDPKLVQLGEGVPWDVDGGKGDLTVNERNIKNVAFVTRKEYGRSRIGPEVQRSRGPEVQRSRGPEVQRSRGPEVQRSRGPEVPRSVPLVGLVSAAVCWRCCWAFPPCSLAPPA